MSEPANADQLKFWNGPSGQRWAALQSDMDRNLAGITAGIMPFAAAKAGERVLDVGCGAGQTTVLLARTVGTSGHVTGVDISAPLLAAARGGAKAANVSADFIEADASSYAFKPEHDLVFSRFGVMFFDNPPAAFANIRKALKPTGRLAFVCWRPAMENEWVAVPGAAARAFIPPQPPVDPLAPGPFAFADPDRVTGILSSAGFRDIRIQKFDGTMNMGASLDHASFQALNLGPLSRAAVDMDDATREKIRLAVKDALARFETPQGVTPGVACWLVGASA